MTQPTTPQKSPDVTVDAARNCPLCGSPLKEKGDECTRCDWVPGYLHRSEKRATRRPRDVAAAVLSVIPGAGHIFKGYLWPGVVLAVVATPLVLLMATALNLFLGWLVPLIFWPAIICDAYFRRDLQPGAKAPETPLPKP